MEILKSAKTVVKSEYEILQESILKLVSPDEVNDAGVSFVDYNKCPELSVPVLVGEMEPVFASPFGKSIFMYEEARVTSTITLRNAVLNWEMPAGVVYINTVNGGGFSVNDRANKFSVKVSSWEDALLEAKKLIGIQIVHFIPFKPL